MEEKEIEYVDEGMPEPLCDTVFRAVNVLTGEVLFALTNQLEARKRLKTIPDPTYVFPEAITPAVYEDENGQRRILVRSIDESALPKA